MTLPVKYLEENEFFFFFFLLDFPVLNQTGNAFREFQSTEEEKVTQFRWKIGLGQSSFQTQSSRDC